MTIIVGAYLQKSLIPEVCKWSPGLQCGQYRWRLE